MSLSLVKISLPTTSDKLRQLFPLDPRGDIEIIFKRKIFRLQKAHLRLQSGYFARVLSPDRSILEIDMPFDQEIFANMLLCFYGVVLEIARREVTEYYKVAEFLEVEAIKKQLREDMAANTAEYNFFMLFDFAYKFSDQPIFEKCLQELEEHEFEQLMSQTQDLLAVSEGLFKLIIKHHTQAGKRKRKFNAYEINNLISEYSQQHGLLPEQRSSIKFELIDKNKLTSTEYDDIFMQDQPLSNTEQLAAIAPGLHRGSSNPVRSEGSIPLHRKFELEMQTTLQKKITEELITQKMQLKEELISLRDRMAGQQLKAQAFVQDCTNYRASVVHKQNKAHLNQRLMALTSSFASIQKLMSQQDESLGKISQTKKQMASRYELPDQKMQVSMSNSESDFWNNNDMDKKQPPKLANPNDSSFDAKSNKSHTHIDNQVNRSKPSVHNRSFEDHSRDVSSAKDPRSFVENKVQFVNEVSIFNSHKEQQALAMILTSSRPVRRKVRVLYNMAKQKGKSFTKNSRLNEEATEVLRQRMKNKSNILVLLRTHADKLIGGFYSSPINLTQVGDYEDEKAFIVSLTEGRKFNVKQDEKKEAIMINQGYIICFGTDLMISDKLFDVQNYCGWPSTYESDPKLEQRGSDWLAGDYQFSIKQIECYEIEETPL